VVKTDASNPNITKKDKSTCFGVVDIWALGILIVIGGDFFSWNAGLQSGFGSMAVSMVITGTAYVCFVFSTGELFSGLPFSGGAYGIVRCTFGFLPGFLIGCTEAIEYIGYVSLSALALISLIGNIIPVSQVLFHILLALFFVISSLLHIIIVRFRRLNFVLGVVCFLTVLLYCFGSLPSTHVKRISIRHVPLSPGGVHRFLNVFPLCSWSFIGIESLTFASTWTVSPKKTIPRASVACVFTLFICGMFVLFAASTTAPTIQELQKDPFPLNNGFSVIFGCSYQIASLFSIPATFATAFGFVFAFSQLLYGLAESGLVPKVLGLKTLNGSPYAAILIGSFISYILCLVIVFVPSMGTFLYQICFLAAYLTYSCQCISYVYIKKRFGGIKFPFKSPFGVYGAMYGLSIFLLAAVSISFFQVDYVALPALILLWLFLSVYYFLFARNHQRFSPEEQRSVLVAHTIRYNCRRSRKARSGRKSNRFQVKSKLNYKSESNISKSSVMSLGSFSLSSKYERFSLRTLLSHK